MDTRTYSVPDMTSGHRLAAVIAAIVRLPGVVQVDSELRTRLVRVVGTALDDVAIAAAIRRSGHST